MQLLCIKVEPKYRVLHTRHAEQIFTRINITIIQQTTEGFHMQIVV